MDVTLRRVKQHRAVMNAKKSLDYFHSTTTAIQGADINLADARALFGALLTEFNEEASLSHLLPSHSIVCNQNFENGLVKIINKEENLLTQTEARAVAIFLNNPDRSVPQPETSTDFGRNILLAVKRQRQELQSNQSAYMPLAWIPCTTCHVERLFSVCRHVYSDWRQAMRPETIEFIVYLRVNRSRWTISTVAAVVNK